MQHANALHADANKCKEKEEKRREEKNLLEMGMCCVWIVLCADGICADADECKEKIKNVHTWTDVFACRCSWLHR